MDSLISGIIGLQQAKVTGEVQIAVAKKLLDMQQFQGASAIKLIQAASDQSCKAGDALVAAATGLGGNLDVVG